MKADIHPNYHTVKVVCGCGGEFETQSTYSQDVMQIDVCSACHPFYTGKQKIVDTLGLVDRFNKRYGRSKAKTTSTSDKTDSNDSQ